MSRSIWTQCGARANLRRLTGSAWRAVEAQHVVSTRKLVASADDQRILEELIDESKPPAHRRARGGRLHYLLSTPFRYPPLPHGSRFGSRQEPSLWYGARTVRTALAESAYYRLLFIEGTTADLGWICVELSSFKVAWRTRRGVDLTRAPFDGHRDRIASPTRYDETQTLGREMRADGVEACRYPSARDVAGGVNVALFDPAAFSTTTPSTLENWHCSASRAGVEFTKRNLHGHLVLGFPRTDFEVDGRLPAPAP